jgi:Ca2+-binding RTX toxin-like protein
MRACALMMYIATVGLALTLTSASAQAQPGRDCLGDPATIVGANTKLHAKGHRSVIVGTRHRDVIVGTSRAEWIVGARGRDVICAGRGRDVLVVGDENRHEEAAKLDGGRGADHIIGSFGGDHIYGGPGKDTIDGQFDGDRIYGGAGDDFVRGQSGADRIYVGGGDDHVEASSGRDVVRGGPGDDNISTGPNDDAAFGEGGDDSVHLLWGDDRGYGGHGNDHLGGGPGEDLCVGGPGPDRITGCEERRHKRGAPLTAAATSDDRPDHKARPRHRHHRHHRLRPFDREPAVHETRQFLHRLERKQAIRSPSATKRQLQRSASLTQRVGRVVDRRYEKRIRHVRRVNAVFRESVERYRFRLLVFAIADEIDRLRWTAPT